MGKKIPFYSESAGTQYTSQVNHIQCNHSATSQQQFAYSSIYVIITSRDITAVSYDPPGQRILFP